MPGLARPWGMMHYRLDGPADGPVVVFANSLGTDLRLWDDLLAQLPEIRALRYDKPGHGLSDAGGRSTVEDLADDAAALIDSLALGPVVFVGLSIGGMIAQALAARRPDLLRGAVLSNTAPRMGAPEAWAARIAAIEAGGMAAIADAVMERWFAPGFRAAPEAAIWRNMLLRCPVPGYAAACAALARADLSDLAPPAGLPVEVLAGADDGASPPDVVAALARAIPGSGFTLLPDCGHIPPVEAPAAMAAVIRRLLARIG